MPKNYGIVSNLYAGIVLNLRLSVKKSYKLRELQRVFRLISFSFFSLKQNMVKLLRWFTDFEAGTILMDKIKKQLSLKSSSVLIAHTNITEKVTGLIYL